MFLDQDAVVVFFGIWERVDTLYYPVRRGQSFMRQGLTIIYYSLTECFYQGSVMCVYVLM